MSRRGGRAGMWQGRGRLVTGISKKGRKRKGTLLSRRRNGGCWRISFRVCGPRIIRSNLTRKFSMIFPWMSPFAMIC